MQSEENKVVVQPVDKSKIRHILKIALYLAVVTFLEFLVAFTLDHGMVKTIIFVLMTIVKAYYIVSEFMHLGHEVKGLRWSIVYPMILVVWLLIALLVEGNYIHLERFF